MALPQVVSPAEWEAARKDYVFDGPDGKVRLDDLFDGRRQLIVQHFMFDPDWDEGCSSCTAGLDEVSDGFIRHINARDTSFAVVARAPIDKIEPYKAKRGWTVPFVSSYGTNFNDDFHVTLDRRMDSVVRPRHRDDRRLVLLLGSHRPRPPGGLGRAEGPPRELPRRHTKFLVTSVDSVEARSTYRAERRPRPRHHEGEPPCPVS